MLAGGVSYSFQYAAPFQLTSQLWTTTTSALVRSYEYKGPDPIISPLTREDLRVELSATQLIGLTSNAALLLRADYTINDSNLPNYTYDNVGVSGGIQIVF